MKTTFYDEKLERDMRQTVHGVMGKVAQECTEPNATPQDAVMRFRVHHETLNLLNQRIATKLQLRSGTFAGKKYLEYADEQRAKCVELLRTAPDRMQELGTFLREAASLAMWKRVMLLLGMVILSCGDSILLSPSLEAALHLTQLESYLMAAALALTIGMAAHSVPRILNISDPDIHKRRLIIILVASAVFFGSLAAMRVTFAAFPDSIPIPIAFVGYTALSALLFFGAVTISNIIYINSSHRPDAEIRRARAEYKELRKEVKMAKAELKKLDKETPALQGEMARRFDYGNDLTRQVIGEARRAWSKYGYEQCRTNGFDQSLFQNYPFEFDDTICSPAGAYKGSATATAVFGLLIGISLVMGSCNTKDLSHATATVMLVDTSDWLGTTFPDTAAMWPYIFPEADTWQGAYFETSVISETNHSPKYASSLKPSIRITENLQRRQMQVMEFKKSVQISMAAVRPHGDNGSKHSIIFARIWESAALLKRMNYGTKQIICFTDCLENGTIDLYDKRQFAMLRSDPEELERRLMSTVTPTDISAIKIFIIYRPKNYEDNLKFSAASLFFKNLLEKNHAVVEIRATL